MRGLRECQGVPDRLPGIGHTRFQTKSTGIAVPQLAGASTFARLPVSNPCLGTLRLCRLRRCGRGFAQTFPHVAMVVDEPFDGFGTHLLVGVLREPVHHLLQVFGMLLQVLVNLVRLLSREARGTSRARVVVQADQSGLLPVQAMPTRRIARPDRCRQCGAEKSLDGSAGHYGRACERVWKDASDACRSRFGFPDR